MASKSARAGRARPSAQRRRTSLRLWPDEPDRPGPPTQRAEARERRLAHAVARGSRRRRPAPRPRRRRPRGRAAAPRRARRRRSRRPPSGAVRAAQASGVLDLLGRRQLLAGGARASASSSSTSEKNSSSVKSWRSASGSGGSWRRASGSKGIGRSQWMVDSSFDSRACSACSSEPLAVGLAGDLAGPRQQLLQRAVLLDQRLGALLADPRHARDVVDRVAHQGQDVGHLLRRHAEVLLHLVAGRRACRGRCGRGRRAGSRAASGPCRRRPGPRRSPPRRPGRRGCRGRRRPRSPRSSRIGMR